MDGTLIQIRSTTREEYLPCCRSVNFVPTAPTFRAGVRITASFAPSDSSQPDVDPETIREWKTLRRNLAFANAALSIGHAEQFVDDDGQSTTACRCDRWRSHRPA